MNNDQFDFIIEAEKIRTVTIEKLKEESAKEEARKKKESEVDVTKTRNAALDLLSWRD